MPETRNDFEQPSDGDIRKRNVAVLVHGYNSEPATWADDTKKFIAKHLSALAVLCSSSQTVDPCWEVRTYDWSSVSSGVTPPVIPHQAYVYAYVIGPRLANEVLNIYGDQLNHVHLIGHSAGAHVIHRAAKKFESEKEKGGRAPTSLQLTFLDAFTPSPIDFLFYGDIDNSVIPNFSDSYMTTFPPSSTIADELLSFTGLGSPVKAASYYIWTQTAQRLAKAYHVGVSKIDQKTSITDPVSWALQDHAWPYQFYQCSTDFSLDSFVSEGLDTSEPCPTSHSVYAFGFPLSLENNPSTTVQGLRRDYKPGQGCHAISTTECINLVAEAKVKIEKTLDAVIEFSDTVVSATGKAVIKVADKIYDLKVDLVNLLDKYGQNAFLPAIQQLNLFSGSPVWVRLRVNIDENANLLRFKFKFNQDGHGYLRAFIHGKEMWSADQRDFETGKIWDAEMGVGELGPGSYEIAFRLDPLTASQTAVELTNFELAKLEAVDAPNMAPIANAGLAQAVRLGSVVTLDGSASSDPDNAPAPLVYSWVQNFSSVQNGTPPTALNDPNAEKPSFTPNGAGIYGFGLTVSDGAATSPSANVVITVPTLGDIDQDGDVGKNDLNQVLAARNTPATGPNDLRDLDGNMMIDALDARKLTTLCSRPRCATQ